MAAGRAAFHARRLALKAAGMTAARLWNGERRPVAASGHMPFPGHRTAAEVERDDALERAHRAGRAKAVAA